MSHADGCLWFHYDSESKVVTLDFRPKSFAHKEDYKLAVKLVEQANKLLAGERRYCKLVKTAMEKGQFLDTNQYVAVFGDSTDTFLITSGIIEKFSDDFREKLHVYSMAIDVNGKRLAEDSDEESLEVAAHVLLELAEA